MKQIAIYTLFIVSTTLIAVNRWTALYISDYRLHFVLLFVAAATFVLIIGHRFQKLQTPRSIVMAIVAVGILCFAKAFFTWGGDWKTETILFRNVDDGHQTIDVQLRGDRFSFGYKKRMVQIRKLAPGLLWTTDVDTSQIDRLKWIKVAEEVNSQPKY